MSASAYPRQRAGESATQVRQDELIQAAKEQRGSNRKDLANSLRQRWKALLDAGVMHNALPTLGDAAEADRKLTILEKQHGLGKYATPATGATPAAPKSAVAAMPPPVKPAVPAPVAPNFTPKQKEAIGQATSGVNSDAADYEWYRNRAAALDKAGGNDEIAREIQRSGPVVAPNPTVEAAKAEAKGVGAMVAQPPARPAPVNDGRPAAEQLADPMLKQMQDRGVVGQGQVLRKTGAGYEAKVPSEMPSDQARGGFRWVGVGPERMAPRGKPLGVTTESPQPFQSSFVPNSGDVIDPKTGQSVGRTLVSKYGSGSSVLPPGMPVGDRKLANDPALVAATQARNSYLATVSGGAAPGPTTPATPAKVPMPPKLDAGSGTNLTGAASSTGNAFSHANAVVNPPAGGPAKGVPAMQAPAVAGLGGLANFAVNAAANAPAMAKDASFNAMQQRQADAATAAAAATAEAARKKKAEDDLAAAQANISAAQPPAAPQSYNAMSGMDAMKALGRRFLGSLAPRY